MKYILNSDLAHLLNIELPEGFTSIDQVIELLKKPLLVQLLCKVPLYDQSEVEMGANNFTSKFN